MHTDAKGLYAILGVDPTASEQAIRAAFRRRAKELHPDMSPDRAPKFIALKGAYDTLRDPSTRAEYDRMCAGPGERSIPQPRSRPPHPPNVPPAPRRPGRTSNYVFAFTFMSAIVLVVIGVLVGVEGESPSPSRPIADTGFGARASHSAKSAAPDAQEPAGEGSSGQSDTQPGDPADAGRQDQIQGESRSRSPRRSSGYDVPRHSDSEPSWWR